LAPPISAVEAKAAGTYALLSFSTLEPAAVTVDYQPAMTSSVPAAGGQSPAQGYAAKHERKLTGLTSNTTYDVTVTATTQAGQKHTAKTSFTTAKKRVRIVLESIDIKSDGDSILAGDGEPVWSFGLSWAGTENTTGYCYPILCYRQDRRYSEGRFTPLNSEGKALMFLFAEEHFDRFPEWVSLGVDADERDSWVGSPIKTWDCITKALSGGCTIGEVTPTIWRVPQGVETGAQRLTIHGYDIETGFESVLTFMFELVHVHGPAPAAYRNAPSSTFK
jgi:hypothetical protein